MLQQILLANMSASVPVVLSNTHTGFSTVSASHPVQMPAMVSAGDLLIVLITTRYSPGGSTIMEPTAAGFTLIGKMLTGASTTQFHIFRKTATGTEGGTTVDFATALGMDSVDAQVVQIQAGTWSGTPVATFAADSASGFNPDPPSRSTVWSGLNVLFFACFGSNGAAAPTVWSLPDNQVTTTSGGATNCRVISCSTVSTAGTLDPGAFTMAATTRWAAATLAIRPV